MPIQTWGGNSDFDYSGCVQTGTEIFFGTGQSEVISPQEWSLLRNQFIGQVVEIGTSRDRPPAGSIGEWFYANIKNQSLMSYVGVILVREGYAIRESSHTIRVIR